MWRLTKLPQPAITIFGGARIKADSKHGKQATELGKMLAGDGFSIITGGGPGIMEAANRGAIEYLNECNIDSDKCKKMEISAAVGLIRLNKEEVNPYVQNYIVMEYFFARKWLLVRYAVGFVVFPGGFGTFDELFEVITLIQCNRMAQTPVILIDKHYWQPLMSWIESCVLEYGLIGKEDKDIIRLVDTPEEAFKILSIECREYDHSVLVDDGKDDVDPQ